MLNKKAAALLALVLLTASLLAQPAPPSAPSSPTPPDGASGVVVDVTLSWASDPQAKKYEISLGTTTPLPLVGTTNGTASFKPPALAPGTTYFWQVTARGAANSSVRGPVWTFTTGTVAHPSMPSNPSPPTGMTNVSVSTGLSWAAASNATGYDVAFGVTMSPAVVSVNQSTTTYQPPILDAATTYYWRITAHGPGGSTAGPVWSFTTAAQAPPPSSTMGRLKLMTWNIQRGLDAGNREAVDAQVALMVDANVDLVGLHEVTIESGRDLTVLYKAKLEAATGRTWYAVWAPAPLAQSSRGEGNLVLSRLPFVSSSIAQFDVAPWDPTWGGTKRSAAHVELRVNNRNLNVFLTHLDPTVSVRTQQLTQFLNWVSTYSAPRLVGGDFNMMPSEDDYGRMIGFFHDAWHMLVERYQAPPGPDPGYTKNVRSIAPWTGQPGRIDYWFYEKESTVVQPTEIAVLETQRSDHHPVIMWVRVQ